MELTSPAFKYGEKIPSTYSHSGGNKSPPLIFHKIPANAKTLVLIMDDYDVPKDLIPCGFYDHWVIFNIPASTTKIEENIPPIGIQGRNSDGHNGYIGMAPPDKEHRYTFKLFALDTELKLSPNVTKTDVKNAMKGHILEQADLVGRYSPIDPVKK